MAIIEDVSKYTPEQLREEAIGLIAAATYRTAVTLKNPKEAVDELENVIEFLELLRSDFESKL